jgi:heme exporter protein CcmD
MYFDSLNAAWDMAGHGPYVWSAYLITLAVVASLIILPHRRARRAQQLLVQAPSDGSSDADQDSTIGGGNASQA